MENDSSNPNGPTTPLPEPPLPEPRLSRRAAWIAMGSVALALGLLWAASDLTEAPSDPALGIAGGEDPADSDAVGKAAPLDFTLKDMNGVKVKLESFKGKIILL